MRSAATLASAHAGIGGTSGGGIVQVVNGSGGTSGSAIDRNSGTIAIGATAIASATGAANANASALGIKQLVDGRNGDAVALVTNGGTLDVSASASAAGSLGATPTPTQAGPADR